MKKITEKEYQRRILKVQVYIQKNLDADLHLDQLAKIACFSPFHFHRIFKGMVGESVKEHVRRLKLERSIAQLKRAKQSVLDIALNAGFETHEAFTRAFREMFGYSPSEMREAAKDFPIINIAKYDLDYIQRLEKLKLTGDKIMKEVTIKKIVYGC